MVLLIVHSIGKPRGSKSRAIEGAVANASSHREATLHLQAPPRNKLISHRLATLAALQQIQSVDYLVFL